jgi:hypothetical protein
VPPRLSELIVGRPKATRTTWKSWCAGSSTTASSTSARRTGRCTDRLDTLRLPTTLVGLLQARLDALPAGERAAARQASVIGHVFWDDALQALDAQAPQALPALQRAAFVRPRQQRLRRHGRAPV